MINFDNIFIKNMKTSVEKTKIKFIWQKTYIWVYLLENVLKIVYN